MQIGDVGPSYADVHCSNYVRWCESIGIPPAPHDCWVKQKGLESSPRQTDLPPISTRSKTKARLTSSLFEREL